MDGLQGNPLACGLPRNSDTPSALGWMDFKVIHTRVPASSLITGGAGIAGSCSALASGAGGTPREATIGLTPDVVVRLEASTPGPAGPIEGAEPEASAVSTRSPRADGEIGAEFPVGF